MAVGQNLVPLVNIKIAGKWMFIPLKMVLIGIDPYPHVAQVPVLLQFQALMGQLKVLEGEMPKQSLLLLSQDSIEISNPSVSLSHSQPYTMKVRRRPTQPRRNKPRLPRPSQSLLKMQAKKRNKRMLPEHRMQRHFLSRPGQPRPRSK